MFRIISTSNYLPLMYRNSFLHIDTSNPTIMLKSLAASRKCFFPRMHSIFYVSLPMETVFCLFIFAIFLFEREKRAQRNQNLIKQINKTPQQQKLNNSNNNNDDDKNTIVIQSFKTR